MSGGSHGYIYCQIDEYLNGQMRDMEMNELINDLIKVAHDLEWWDSSDMGEEDYRKTVRKFKAKWFGDRNERIIGYINQSCEKLKVELTEMVGK
jgi:hypothetical protein